MIHVGFLLRCLQLSNLRLDELANCPHIILAEALRSQSPDRAACDTPLFSRRQFLGISPQQSNNLGRLVQCLSPIRAAAGTQSCRMVPL